MIETQNEKYMRSLFLLLALLLCVFFSPAKVLAAEPLADVTVLVEGKLLNMPVPPVIVDNRTLVGARSVGEAVGGQVEWDPVKRQVTITRRSDTIILTLGKTEALVNGKTVVMEVPAQLVNSSTMVPLRFIAESLGGTVEWDAPTRTANILRKPSAITDWSYTKDVGKATLKLTLSEPAIAITPSISGDSNLVLDFYPAEIKTPSIANFPMDGLIRGYSLQPEERHARLVVQLWTTPAYTYTLSPDGTQVTIEFRYTVTGIQYQMNGRVPTVNIATTGKVNYTTQVLTGPDRLVIDLPGTVLGSQVPSPVVGGQPLVNQVRSAPFSKDPLVTRIVIDLAKVHDYDIISTDLGLQVRFVPRVLDVKTETNSGKTRLSILTSLPVDSLVTVPDGSKQMVITLAGATSGLKSNTINVGTGGLGTVTVVPDAATYTTKLTVGLDYYLGHTVVSKPGDLLTVVDLVSSPVYGKRIWIDAGHGQIPGGKDDPGAIGTTYGTQEKLVNLLVALELQKQLEAAGAKVYMTRTTSVGVDFTDRPALVNAVKPPIDIFISIHHNSLPSSSSVHGTETYYWTAKSRALATAVHAAVIKSLGFSDRRVRSDMEYYVIAKTVAPSILVELGYLTNPGEEKAIAEPGAAIKTYPTKAAEGIKNGIFNYFWQEIKPAVTN